MLYCGVNGSYPLTSGGAAGDGKAVPGWRSRPEKAFHQGEYRKEGVHELERGGRRSLWMKKRAEGSEPEGGLGEELVGFAVWA